MAELKENKTQDGKEDTLAKSRKVVTVQSNLEADLDTRPNSHVPSRAELQKLELFQQLKKDPDIAKFPKSMVVRRIAKGEVIVRQGEAGATAFYILTNNDVISLKKYQQEKSSADSGDAETLEGLSVEIGKFEERQRSLEGKAKDDAARCVATAHLLFDSHSPSARRPRGVMEHIKRFFGGDGASTALKQPTHIAIDGPSDIDYEKRTAPMYEGDIFGEMSCLTYSPRSATVVADVDCYMLEFNRNIFDQIQKDQGFQRRTEEIYRERVLDTQFRRMELFNDMSDEDLDFVREHAKLEVFEPGEVLFDEGDEADCIYLIRSGLVQVVKNVNVRITEDDILDWKKLCVAILKGAPVEKAAVEKESKAGTPAGTKLAAPASAKPSPAAKKPAGTSKAAAKGMSVKDKLAMLRGGPAPAADESSASEPSPTPDEKPSAKPKAAAKGMSVKDKLAMLRGGKGKDGPAKDDAAKAAASVKTDTDSAKAAGGKSDVLAAARAAKAKPSPMDALPKKKKATDSPEEHLWKILPSDVRLAIREIASDNPATEAAEETPEPDATSSRIQSLQGDIAAKMADKRKQVRSDQERHILAALNDVLRNRDFVTGKSTETLRKKHDKLAPTLSFGKSWTGIEMRVAGRLLLEVFCGDSLRSRSQVGKFPRILAYLGRGDIIGEMAVADPDQKTRSASVVAYDHPDDDSKRRPSRLEMIRIEKKIFLELLERSGPLKNRVGRKIVERKAHTPAVKQEQPWERNSLIELNEFRDMGLAQGQKLLLIDLDRCTRCGDCVRACVETHDDGHTRLFLDGPRFDHFLVPSACRNCRDPACMIGCPVGSIQRGDNGEILIRDWCIGCEVCAKQCPYDSIQMHDHGIIPEQSLGWQCLPTSSVRGDAWRNPGYPVHDWLMMMGPVTCGPHFVTAFADKLRPNESSPVRACFRYILDGTNHNGRDRAILFTISSKSEGVTLWLNGTPVDLQQDDKQKRRGEFTASVPNTLRSGENVVAVEVTLPVKEGDPVLALRLDYVVELTTIPEGIDEAEVKQVTKKAVVCDLCSSTPSQDPACVAQCPHDAAFRTDVLFDPQRIQAT